MSSSMRLRRSPKPGRLDGDCREGSAELVDDDRGESLALDVLGDDQQRPTGLDDLLEHGQEILDGADLLVRDQDVRLVEHGLHALGVGDHVRREVALVELHALGELELEPEGLALLDVDDAVLADPVDRVGDDVADLALASRDRGDPGDVFLARDPLRLLLQILDDRLDGLLDAALDPHRVRAGSDVLQALADNRLGEHRRRRRAVSGNVVGRRRDLFDELCALILERVLDLDLACDRDSVVRDRRCAELLVEHDVPTLRAKGDLDRVGEDVDAALERAPRLLVELQFFMSHVISPSFVMVTRRTRRRALSSCSTWRPWLRDLREHVRLAQDENFVGTDLDVGPAVLRVDDLVADGDFHRHDLALVVAGARADCEDAAALRLLLRGVGQNDPARRRLLFLEGLDDDAIAQWLQIHSGPPVQTL